MPVAVVTCRDYLYKKDGSPDYSQGLKTFISHGVDTETLKNVITDNELFEVAKMQGRITFDSCYGWVFKEHKTDGSDFK